MEMRDYIIENYSRSPGVRGLKKYIQKICERIAFQIVQQDTQAAEGLNEVIVITQDNLVDFIGDARYQSKKFY